MPVLDWWEAATPARRRLFLKAVRSGQIEVAALPFNNTPFMDAAQWQTMTHWLPDDLWKEVQPRVAIQNDVNGLPRAAALALLDRGVRHLFTGINEDSGGVPFPRNSAFWWRMPDGRRLFVWLNTGYGSGFDFFEPAEWRRGPVPRAADAAFRPPATATSCDPTNHRSAPPTRYASNASAASSPAATGTRSSPFPSPASGDSTTTRPSRPWPGLWPLGIGSASPRAFVSPPSATPCSASKPPSVPPPRIHRGMDRLVGQRHRLVAARRRRQPRRQTLPRRRPIAPLGPAHPVRHPHPRRPLSRPLPVR